MYVTLKQLHHTTLVPATKMHLTQEAIQLTTNSSCLLCTPHSSSNSRHRSHSDIVIRTSSESIQSSRGWRRWSWEGRSTAPRRCPAISVLYLVLIDGQVTLGASPGHPQICCPRYPGQGNMSDTWGTYIYQREISLRSKHSIMPRQWVPIKGVTVAHQVDKQYNTLVKWTN